MNIREAEKRQRRVSVLEGPWPSLTLSAGAPRRAMEAFWKEMQVWRAIVGILGRMVGW